jgi:tetratricopeptide (TPR) repeat protein
MLRGSLVFATMLAASSLAHAQPDKRAQALALADDSEHAYKAGQFEKAAALLRKAHDKYPEPILLYNLGRALEGMGDTSGAIDAYEQYLKDAKQIDDRPAIERRIATLKAQLDKARQDEEQKAQQAQQDKEHLEQDRVAKEQADKDRLAAEQAEKDRAAKEQADKERLAKEPPSQLPPLPPRVAHDSDEPSTAERFGPWVTLGAGGALIATGIVFGTRASSNHDDAVNAKVQLEAQRLQDSAQTDATIANVMFVVGGAAVIGGGIWEYIEWQRALGRGLGATQPKEPTGARLRIAPTGIALEWKLP